MNKYIFVILLLCLFGCEPVDDNIDKRVVVERSMKDKRFSNCDFAYIGTCKYVYCIDHFGDVSALATTGPCIIKNNKISTNIKFTE